MKMSSADVPLSFLEYRLLFRDPIFESWTMDGGVISVVYQALREFGVGLENITSEPNPKNAGEVRLVAELASMRSTFVLRLGELGIIVNNPNWTEADSILGMAQSGIRRIREKIGFVASNQTISLALHIAPRDRDIRTMIAGLVTLKMKLLDDSAPTGFGIATYFIDHSWVIDLSTIYPNALFIKWDRTHKADVSLSEILGSIRNDQASLLRQLGLEPT